MLSYLRNKTPAYTRTISDVAGKLSNNATVLEIGSFYGVVSVGLAGHGYRVIATDLQDVTDGMYAAVSIPFVQLDLRDGELPFDSSMFDAVVMCEVLEHLPFNPVPVLREIRRVLNPEGFLYLTTPNQASLRNRMKLLFGMSTRNSIRQFQTPLDIGIHWREYTMDEVRELLKMAGLRVTQKRYEYGNGELGRSMTWLYRTICKYPSFRPYQIIFASRFK
jgi:SAM-dependent methyltransferase